jgi:hypothetical protein
MLRISTLSLYRLFPGPTAWPVADPMLQAAFDLGFESFIADRDARVDRMTQFLHIGCI